MGSLPAISEWRKLPLSLTELCIDTTLRCGQAFRWRKIGDEWHCALHGRILSLKQDATHLHYRATWPRRVNTTGPKDQSQDDDTLSLLHTYFNLSHSLPALYTTWSARDKNFARRSAAFEGIRILNQDPWEALVAFICSSNNNIARIAGMLSRLCTSFGADLGRLDPAEHEGVEGESFHDFPTPEDLAGPEVESALRDLGFGYRARYVAEAARMVAHERPAGWLDRLRNPAWPGPGSVESPELKEEHHQKERKNEEEEKEEEDKQTYLAARDALISLPGVGPKVADCVCLMGLGWSEAVPVDTHVWQIAKRDYGFGRGGRGSGGSAAGAGGGGNGKKVAMSKAAYDAVGDHFRGIWGPYAGWAQSVLFTANLRSFAEQAAGTPVKGVAGEGKVEVEEESVVKVEKGGEETVMVVDTARVLRKRRAGTKAEDVKVEKVTEVRVTRTRSSKRRKTGGT